MVLAAFAGLSMGDQPDFMPPDVLAVYEAGADLLAINASFAELFTADAEMKRTLNHETYHRLQAVCTGYGWARALRIMRTTIKHINAAGRAEWKDNGGFYRAIFFLHWLPKRIQRKIEVPRLVNAMQLVMESNQLRRLKLQLDPADPSLAAAEFPGLFAELDMVSTALWRRENTGLSAGHVMEAGPILHEALLTAVTRHGADVLSRENGESLDQAALQIAAPLGEEYSALLVAARAQLSAPAALRALPAAALALHYERPGAAFPPLIAQLPDADYPEVRAAATQVAASLPAIEGAGGILGTARAAAATEQRRWRLPWKRPPAAPCSRIPALLASGSHDELSVLTDVAAFGDLPEGFVQCTARFNDVVISLPNVPPAERMAANMQASVALRALTRSKMARNLEERAVYRARTILNNSLGLGPPMDILP